MSRTCFEKIVLISSTDVRGNEIICVQSLWDLKSNNGDSATREAFQTWDEMVDNAATWTIVLSPPLERGSCCCPPNDKRSWSYVTPFFNGVNRKEHSQLSQLSPSRNVDELLPPMRMHCRIHCMSHTRGWSVKLEMWRWAHGDAVSAACAATSKIGTASRKYINTSRLQL